MRSLIREYLASLRERDELDAILPDLLSEMGYTVLSRPSRGTRQFGVDVAAIGPPGDERLYLLSIKRGDLTRAEWDGQSAQALRPSLNEILDVYIPAHVPDEHRSRPVVICLCFGGDVHEQVRPNLTNFQKVNERPGISFAEWNGDVIAGHIETGLLREGLLTRPMRSSFRKAVAMLDEPDISFAHFSALVGALLAAAVGAPERARVTAARQVCICLWVLFVWARDAGNVESAYLASERAVLAVWHMLRDEARADRPSEAISSIINQVVELHFQVADELIGKILPHAGATYAVSAAVLSASPLDVNLKLFEMLGRIALRGLWLTWGEPGSGPFPTPRQGRSRDSRIDRMAQGVCRLVASNPALLMPVSDDQAVDLTLAFMFLAAQGGSSDALRDWVREIVNRTRYAFRTHKAYPCVHRDYRDLAEHPRDQTDEYRQAATGGSVLLPTLAFWAAGLGDGETLSCLADFKRDDLDHCTFQFWLPDLDSEDNLYIDAESHGAAFTDIPVSEDPGVVLGYVLRECGEKTPFYGLSAVAAGHWPIVALACRHFRLPIPPHLWTGLLPGCGYVVAVPADPSC
jgi:hypothetical protein